MVIGLAPPGVERECERVLRTLPRWFGVEASILDYARDAGTLPTFVSAERDVVNGFITLRHHFEQSFEIHCLAVEAQRRGTGIGRSLVSHASSWASRQGGRFLQVKTIAAGHPSPEFAQTRAFYVRIGFVPIEVFPALWSTDHPCLQMVKSLDDSGQAT